MLTLQHVFIVIKLGIVDQSMILLVVTTQFALSGDWIVNDRHATET